MSGYILCQVPRAKVPYYIDSISTNIYAIEELCYFFHQNLSLLDDTILNEELALWLRRELGLDKLYQKLHNALSEGLGSIREFVYPVFKEVNYLPYEKMKEYEGKIALLEKESLPVRQKMKGDRLVGNGMYVNALKVYQGLLGQKSEELEEHLLGSIYHNAGCAYSYLFQKEEALLCFEKAYQKLHTKGALKSYLYAFYNAREPLEYAGKLMELGVDEQTKAEIQKEIDSIQNSDQPAIQDDQIDGILEKMIKEYHRSTGA